MNYFKKECEERGATIIYATHIFDGLENWPTHIVSIAAMHDSFMKFIYKPLC